MRHHHAGEWRTVTLLLLTSIFVLGCRRDAADAPPSHLRIGYLPIAAELPLFVAVGEGYFEDEGIQIELAQFPSSNELTNAGTAARVDVLAGAALNVVFDSGEVSNKKHKLFALNPYSDREGFVTDHLVVGANAGIIDVSGLRGKRIASFPGSVVVLVHLILEDYGLPPGSYQSIQMLPKDWQPSLQSGAVDAVVALEPSATQIIHDGVGRSILPGFYAKLIQDLPLSGHWFAADYLAEASPDQIAAILRVYSRAISFCRESPELARKYLVNYANVRPDIVDAVNLNPWKMVSTDARAEVAQYATLLAGNGGVAGSVQVDQYLLER